jgi:hypothetical protein
LAFVQTKCYSFRQDYRDKNVDKKKVRQTFLKPQKLIKSFELFIFAVQVKLKKKKLNTRKKKQDYV